VQHDVWMTRGNGTGLAEERLDDWLMTCNNEDGCARGIRGIHYFGILKNRFRLNDTLNTGFLLNVWTLPK
jgi:hypothetical protein